MDRLSKTRLRQGKQSPEKKPEVEALTPADLDQQQSEENALLGPVPEEKLDDSTEL